MFVKIIDPGECFSSTMEYVDGVYANKSEWEKHNFYPQNGMVGELVKVTPRAYIVKIMDGIYVPMTQRGICEISEEEYLANKHHNVCTGMNERQRKINVGTDVVVGESWKHIPNMRESFKQDIIANITKLTCDFSINIYLPDLERSCVIYATDMILEYGKQWGSTLPPHVTTEISIQVTDVYCELFNGQFLDISVQRCTEQIKDLVQQIDARSVIDNYYYQINQRYSLH